VVTATVYMTDGRRARPAVDNKALLVSAVIFGILFFACLGGILYMYSLLRRARRVRSDRARFGMVDDDDQSISGQSNIIAPVAVARDERSRKLSEMSDAGRLVQGPAAVFNRDEKRPARRASIMSEYVSQSPPRANLLAETLSSSRNDPFLDPPQSANSLTGFSYPFMQENPVSRPATSSTRPYLTQTVSEVDTLSSATSMQLFGTTGGLRVTNDPAEISTPNVSYPTTVERCQYITC
jgi:hypothetical protein